MNTVNGIELSTYGLRLARLDGHLDYPKYKQILDEHDHSAQMKVAEDKKVRVKLIGTYATLAAMGTAMSTFHTAVKGAARLQWIFTGHDFDEYCVVADGISASVHGQRGIELNFTLTISEL
jgi:hypothetical protein